MEELSVTALGHQGDGLAEGPGGIVRVPFALPGERVRGTVRDGRMEGAEVLAPAPERVAAPCPAFGTCGGCALQHTADGFLAGWKAEGVRRTLGQAGLSAEIAGVATSPERSRRRAVFSLLRTRRGPVAGFHARGSERVVDVAACHVLRPELLALRPALLALAALLAPRSGEVKAHAALTGAGIDLDLRGGKPPDGAGRLALARIAGEHDLARLSVEGEPVAVRRPPALAFGRARVVPPPGGFLQPTAEGEAALLAAVRAALAGADPVADLFAGAGTFAIPLAEAAEVHAAEGDAGAVAALLAGWRGAPGLRRVGAEARDLFRRPLLPAELRRFSGAVIDPPRQGARAQVEAIAASALPRLAMVSCNPATFARDAATLVAAGFRMGPVTVVDQFRWSPHVELVAAFAR